MEACWKKLNPQAVASCHYVLS